MIDKNVYLVEFLLIHKLAGNLNSYVIYIYTDRIRKCFVLM